MYTQSLHGLLYNFFLSLISLIDICFIASIILVVKSTYLSCHILNWCIKFYFTAYWKFLACITYFCRALNFRLYFVHFGPGKVANCTCLMYNHTKCLNLMKLTVSVEPLNTVFSKSLENYCKTHENGTLYTMYYYRCWHIPWSLVTTAVSYKSWICWNMMLRLRCTYTFSFFLYVYCYFTRGVFLLVLAVPIILFLNTKSMYITENKTSRGNIDFTEDNSFLVHCNYYTVKTVNGYYYILVYNLLCGLKKNKDGCLF